MKTATIFDIERNSYVDGPGIRTTVFFKGCNLKCAWCHNPESQVFQPQMMFYQDQCKACGKCMQICPSPDLCTLCGKCTLYCPADARKVCGKKYTVDDVWKEIRKDRAFYDHSGGGVTFSGGECMLQTDFLEDVLIKCKENGIHTAVDTAGHVPFDSFKKIMPHTDLFLYDLKMIDSAEHLQYTGVGNELILENLKKLFSAGAQIWIRIPVIAGINDTAEQMQSISRFLLSCGKPQKVELLPYHAMGENKYAAIGKTAQSFAAPDENALRKLQAIFDGCVSYTTPPLRSKQQIP